MPLADLFVAVDVKPEIDIDRIPSVASRYRATNVRIDVKGFDIVPLVSLWSLLRAIPETPSDVDQFTPVHQGEETVVMRLPSDMVRRLATLTQDDVTRISAHWAKTDEVRAVSKRIPGIVEQTLAKIVVLAQRAQSKDKTLFLWMAV